MVIPSSTPRSNDGKTTALTEWLKITVYFDFLPIFHYFHLLGFCFVDSLIFSLFFAFWSSISVSSLKNVLNPINGDFDNLFLLNFSSHVIPYKNGFWIIFGVNLKMTHWNFPSILVEKGICGLNTDMAS